MLHLNQRKVLHDPVIPLRPGARRTEYLVNRKLHILINRQPWQQAMVLKHHGPFRSGLGNFPVLKQNPAV
jgi:hypothetical protein